MLQVSAAVELSAAGELEVDVLHVCCVQGSLLSAACGACNGPDLTKSTNIILFLISVSTSGLDPSQVSLLFTLNLSAV